MSALPPLLANHSITVTPGHTVIDLEFNEAIERGTGTVIVTDGALQTVIDRVSGLPTTRIVGATDTRHIDTSQFVGIDGNTATIHADGLLPNHHYRVFILPGVFQYDGMPFAGVSNGSLLAFTSGAAAEAPTAIISLGGSHVSGASGVTVTVKFSEIVPNLTSAAFTTPHGVLSNLHTLDDGTTWAATLLADGNGDASGNALSLDMSQVQDQYGNAGSGTTHSGSNYDVDITPPAATLSLDQTHLATSDGATLTITFSEAVSALDPSWFATTQATVSNLAPNSDGTVWTATLTPSASSSDNKISLDMTKVHDLAGNAGSGSPDVSFDVTNVVDATGVVIAFDHSDLRYGGDIHATISFPTTMSALPISALTGQNVTIIDEGHTDSNGMTTWSLTLEPGAGGVDSSGNVLSLDMTKVTDSSGHAGTGTATSPTYSIDSVVTSYVEGIRLEHDTGVDGSDFVTNNPVAQFEGLLNAGLTGAQQVEVQVDGEVLTTSNLSDGTAWYYTPTTAPTLADGTHTVSVRIVDNGHYSAPLTQTFVVDQSAAALAAPALDPASDNGVLSTDAVTSDQTPIFKGTGAEALAAITLFSDGVKVGEGAADANGNWSIKSGTISAEGIHQITATQTDLAGNVSNASAASDLNIEYNAPSLTSVPTSVDTGGTYMLKFSDLIQIAGSIGEVDLYMGDAITPLMQINAGDAQWTTETSGNLKYSVLKLTGLADGDYHLHFTLSSPVNLVGIAATDLLHDISFHVGTPA